MEKSFNPPVLWEHQRNGANKMMEAYKARDMGYGLFFDPGTGKTLTTITFLREVFNIQKRICPTLIFAPVIVLKNWKDEWLKFSRLKSKDVLVLTGSVAKRIELLEKRLEESRNIIVVTNYEGMAKPNKEGKNKNQVAFFRLLKKFQPEFVILDESQRIKNHNSKRTWCVTQLAYLSEFCVLLTGSPITNTPMDIFSQFRALDKGLTFGKNFTVFKGHYFEDMNVGMPKDKYFPDWQLRMDKVDELNKKIYKKAMRAVKEDCLDLPPFIKKTIEVEMTPEQKRLYTQMKNDFITWLEDKKSGENKAIVANLAITKALRLQQIVTGVVKLEDEDEPRLLKPTPREAALKELLMDITPGHKVLVWCVFKKNYDQVRRVCEQLKIKYVEAHGSISNKNKYAAVDEFNNKDEFRVFIGHPAALGIGINLVGASYSIYYSRNFSLENDIQSEARNYRGGSDIHEKITRIDLVAPGTIDEQILKALNDKINISEEILDWKDKI